MNCGPTSAAPLAPQDSLPARCLGVLRSGCGCQFAGDAGCPVIDPRPVAEVAAGKSRGRPELAKSPFMCLRFVFLLIT